MFYVYALIDKNKNFYIGYSKDLKSRIMEHELGNVYSTKSKLPIKLVYYEACLNNYDAIKRERYLKSGPGRKYLKNRIRIFLKDKI